MDLIDAVDFPVIDKVNAVGGAFIVLATYIFGEHWVLFAAFLVLNVLDYITGIMKSRVLKNVSSNAGLKGVIKKFLYWIVVLIAFGMSPVFNEIGEAIGTDFSPYTPFIGWFVLASMGFNEFRSIMENFVEAGVPVPSVLIKSLKVAEKLLEKQEEKIDGALDLIDNSSEPYHIKINTPKEKLEEKGTVTLKIRTVHREDEPT